MVKLLIAKRTKLLTAKKYILDTYAFKDKAGKLIFEELPPAPWPTLMGLRRAHRLRR